MRRKHKDFKKLRDYKLKLEKSIVVEPIVFSKKQPKGRNKQNGI